MSQIYILNPFSKHNDAINLNKRGCKQALQLMDPMFLNSAFIQIVIPRSG